MRTFVRVGNTFWLAVAALFTMLAVLCACETVQGDGWGQFLRAHNEGPLTWERFVGLVRYEHSHGNPRWGQVVVIVLYELRFVHVFITPLAIVVVLLASLVLICGRWPRPSDPNDTWLLVVVIALALTTTPQVGAIWFHRPTCSNYIYPLAVQLCWLIPYRFLVTRRAGSGPLAVNGMLAVGLLAGAGNEHTGIALGLAAAGACYLAWRRDRCVPTWAIAGVIGLAVGNAWLLRAPAQLARYGAIGAHESLAARFASRGVLGNLELPALLAAWLLPALILVMAAGLPALRHCKRAAVRGAQIYAGVACVILVTALASPKQVPRLLVAPAALIAIAIGVMLVEVMRVPPIARRVRIAVALIVALYFAIMLCIHVITRRDGDERIGLLLRAVPGSVVNVPAFTFSMPTPFSLGDDLRSGRLRRRIATGLDLREVNR